MMTHHACSSHSTSPRPAPFRLCPRAGARWRHDDESPHHGRGRPAMLKYLIRRVMVMVPTLLAISAIVFIIIKLPPGDFLSTMMAEIAARGEGTSNAQQIAFLREQYGLDQPAIVQYFTWLFGMLHGDLGWSFEFNVPV